MCMRACQLNPAAALGTAEDVQEAQCCREINKGGLNALYEILLLASMPEYGRTMKVQFPPPCLVTVFQHTLVCDVSGEAPLIVVKVTLGSLEAKKPLLFYCKAGKDRTGLLAMLILSVCGVPDDAIIDDYVRCALHSFRPRCHHSLRMSHSLPQTCCVNYQVGTQVLCVSQIGRVWQDGTWGLGKQEAGGKARPRDLLESPQRSDASCHHCHQVCCPCSLHWLLVSTWTLAALLQCATAEQARG